MAFFAVELLCRVEQRRVEPHSERYSMYLVSATPVSSINRSDVSFLLALAGKWEKDLASRGSQRLL